MIVYIVTKLELGGAQKVVLALFERLGKKQKTILISGSSGELVRTPSIHEPARTEWPPKAVVSKYRVHTQGERLEQDIILLDSMTREVSFFGIWREIKNFFALVQTLRKLRAQENNLIVHTHSTKAGLVGRWAAFCARIKHRVHTVHGFGFHPHQNKIFWTINYLLELITSVITTEYICVSETDRTTGRALIPFFARKSSLIRAAVDAEKFTPAQKKHSRKYVFGTIACFKPQKNLDDLLRAFAHAYIQNASITLEIIGDGVLRSHLETLAAELDIAHAVTFHGWQHDVVPSMQNWDAFVLTSLWEGLPCAIVEARLLQLPVIAYNTGGISEIIFHGVNGFLYPPREWRACAHAMVKLSTDELLHAQLKNYPDELKQFTYTAMAYSHEKVYARIAAGRNR